MAFRRLMRQAYVRDYAALRSMRLGRGCFYLVHQGCLDVVKLRFTDLSADRPAKTGLGEGGGTITRRFALSCR